MSSLHGSSRRKLMWSPEVASENLKLEQRNKFWSKYDGEIILSINCILRTKGLRDYLQSKNKNFNTTLTTTQFYFHFHLKYIWSAAHDVLLHFII